MSLDFIQVVARRNIVHIYTSLHQIMKECGAVEKRTLGRNASLFCEHVDDYRRTKVQQVTSNKAGSDNCGSRMSKILRWRRHSDPDLQPIRL
ncbi:hypothetical protein NC652_036090 [Populus alba x Populus x berolinensis]|nr:hypothetical protein NC652_036090 [Populus alba x Populus x berolinensis]